MLSFIALAAFSALAFVFVYYLVPETANRTVEEILMLILGPDYRGTQSEVVKAEDE